MIWYITLRDMFSFYKTQKTVFIWLLICMVSGSFVLNYSYSFARYRGKIYEYNSGDVVLRYKINNASQTKDCAAIIDQIIQSDLPEIKDYQIFKRSGDGLMVVGSSFISENLSSFTGVWREGYVSAIENTGENVCAVEIGLLDYNGRLKMTGETFVLDGEEFKIRGVFETLENNSGIVIFADKFMDKYKECDSLYITFSRYLSEEQRTKFERIVKTNTKNGTLIYPPEPGTLGMHIVKLNELQYTAIIIMLVICVVSLIKYWQTVNLPAYTVYWINGATTGKIICVALCESLSLCVSTYMIGLALNMAARRLLTFGAALEMNDIVIGFLSFFGTFAIFTLINTVKICKDFKITNVRRD